jgi:hypothetical protein
MAPANIRPDLSSHNQTEMYQPSQQKIWCLNLVAGAPRAVNPAFNPLVLRRSPGILNWPPGVCGEGKGEILQRRVQTKAVLGFKPDIHSCGRSPFPFPSAAVYGTGFSSLIGAYDQLLYSSDQPLTFRTSIALHTHEAIPNWTLANREVVPSRSDCLSQIYPIGRTCRSTSFPRKIGHRL